MHISMIDANRGRITADLSGGVLGQLRKMPSGVTWDDRDAIFSISALNLKYLKTTFPNATWDTGFDQHFFLLEQRAREAAQLVDKKYQKLSKEADTHLYKREPFNHQRKALLVSKDEPAYGLLAEAGTGKSAIIINNIAHLYRDSKIQQALIFSENGLHHKWRQHCSNDMPDDIDYQLYIYATKRLDKDWASIESMVKAPLGLKIISMNIEALSLEKGWEFVKWFIKQNATFVCIDEFQSIGVPSSKRSRNAVKMGAMAPYRRGMTGPLVAEGVHRVYSPMQYLDKKILECKNYEEFLERYTVRVGKFKKIVGTRNLDDLMARLEPYTFAIDKKDCLDLPPQYWVDRPTELSPDQKRVYKQLKNDFYAEIKDGQFIEAELMIKRLVKLQQIVGGFVKMPPDDSHPKDWFIDFEDTPRLRSTLPLVPSIRGKIIIWCAFKREVYLISKALTSAGVTNVTFYGDVSLEQGIKNMDQFRADPNVKVLVGTPRKGGKGYDLYEASTVIYFSHNWSNELRIQSEARVHRPGQTEAVTYYDLYVPGTVDKRIMDAVKKKQKIAELLKSPSVVLEWLEDDPD
jgi:hypothetical protein